MDAAAPRQEESLRQSEDLVVECQADAAGFGEDAADGEFVVMARRRVVPHRQLNDRQHEAASFEPTIRPRPVGVRRSNVANPIGSPHLEPGQVLGVMRDPHGISLGIPHADDALVAHSEMRAGRVWFAHALRLASGLALIGVISACSAAGRPDGRAPAAAAAADDAPRAIASPPPSPSAPLRLLRVSPPDGSLIAPRATLVLEFDRMLEPSSILGALSFEYVEPNATFLADPFRHVGFRLSPDGRMLIVEPSELLVGREVRARLSPTLRGSDGSRGAPDVAQVFTFRVMELPP